MTENVRLCDDNGMVSDTPVEPGSHGTEFTPGLTYLRLLNNLRAHTGLPPVTEAFHCTGSAHLAGMEFHCTSPVHQQARRLAVDAAGYGWWWNDDGSWSMIRTNPDNSPIPRPVTFYVPAERAASELDAVAEDLLGVGDTAPSGEQVRLAAWLQATADTLRAPMADDACDHCGSTDPYECRDGCGCPDCVDGEDREP